MQDSSNFEISDLINQAFFDGVAGQFGIIFHVELLEQSLTHLADTVTRDLGCNFRNEPGAGAAGGLGRGPGALPPGAEHCHARARHAPSEHRRPSRRVLRGGQEHQEAVQEHRQRYNWRSGGVLWMLDEAELGVIFSI